MRLVKRTAPVGTAKRQRPLAEAGTVARDVAVALERNHYNGAVEARVVLKSLAATRPGAVVDAVPAPALAEAIAAELAADPLAWWPVGDGRDGVGATAHGAPPGRRSPPQPWPATGHGTAPADGSPPRGRW